MAIRIKLHCPWSGFAVGFGRGYSGALSFLGALFAVWRGGGRGGGGLKALSDSFAGLYGKQQHQSVHYLEHKNAAERALKGTRICPPAFSPPLLTARVS